MELFSSSLVNCVWGCKLGLAVLVGRLCILSRRHHLHGVPRLWGVGLLL